MGHAAFTIEELKLVRIVIAEDHPIFRSGIRGLLATTDDLEVVGEAATGEEALKRAGELQPDLMLMDIRMPGMNGIEATQAIKEKYPAIEVLILTMYRDDQSVFTAMRVGAKGYVLKDADEDELLQAVRMVGSGHAVFSSGIAERMMHYFASQVSGSAASSEQADHETVRSALRAHPAFEELTRREADILALIAKGDTNAQIASHLHISIKTVANNVSNILNKLQVIDRHEARKLIQDWKRS